jgi:cytochrome P450
MHLARRELRIAIETFLSRFNAIHIPEGRSYEYHAGPTLTMNRLPIAWEC